MSRKFLPFFLRQLSQFDDRLLDPAERALMEHACTQLQPLPCKWDRCDVVMNSVIGMLSHLKKQHKPVMKDGRAVSSLPSYSAYFGSVT